MAVGPTRPPVPAPQHSLVYGIHGGVDLGLPSVAQLLACLPEAEVLSWKATSPVRPTQAVAGPGRNPEGPRAGHSASHH